ncbi:MAG: hypothetical protein ABW061_18570 [Polyangiaceae bacterium]
MPRSFDFLTGLAVALLWTSAAVAEPSPADRATARSLAGEGYQALQDKDYATAADRFGRADALIHAPTLMIDWARSLVGLGKLVEAQERYEQIVREGVDAKAPKSWQRALNDANKELADLKPRLAWVTINVASANDAHVTIDGAPVPPAAIGVRRAVNPGPRLVRAQANGYLPQKKTLDLNEGNEEAVSFTLEPDPDAQAAVVEKAPVQPVVVPPPAKHDRTPMYVAFGVSGAGLVLGSVTGLLWLGKRSDLKKVCNSDRGCLPDQSDAVSASRTFGTLSGVGFALGIVGAGTGVTLWYVNRDRNASTAQGLTVHPYLGFASVGAQGSF